MDIEVPQAVLPDTVFEAVVRIPYDKQLKQVLANGKKRDHLFSFVHQHLNDEEAFFISWGTVPLKN
ncbi:Apocytochrome f [Acorus gramineus]|uniref:Apocytochrome f n=1 Tax=Acorus gramineus TaxID=55184 RepID=A0AAV9B172_ACOGR|nr:Apocytochrome f [Acorus gramineus]